MRVFFIYTARAEIMSGPTVFECVDRQWFDWNGGGFRLANIPRSRKWLQPAFRCGKENVIPRNTALIITGAGAGQTNTKKKNEWKRIEPDLSIRHTIIPAIEAITAGFANKSNPNAQFEGLIWIHGLCEIISFHCWEVSMRAGPRHPGLAPQISFNAMEKIL